MSVLAVVFVGHVTFRPMVSSAAKRGVRLSTRLRRARQYPTIYARTNRYKTLIVFGLNHLQ